MRVQSQKGVRGGGGGGGGPTHPLGHQYNRHETKPYQALKQFSSREQNINAIDGPAKNTLPPFLYSEPDEHKEKANIPEHVIF